MGRGNLGGMKHRLPRRRLVDWTPEAGDQREWLARLADEGWVPEHGAGVPTTINGRRVVRFAMIARQRSAPPEPENEHEEPPPRRDGGAGALRVGR